MLIDCKEFCQRRVAGLRPIFTGISLGRFIVAFINQAIIRRVAEVDEGTVTALENVEWRLEILDGATCRAAVWTRAIDWGHVMLRLDKSLLAISY